MGSLAAAFAVEKCGIGVDDWETMFFASAALPSQEQAFLRRIMGDVDNLSVPKLHHHRPFSSQPPAVEFDVAITGVGFGIVDPVLETSFLFSQTNKLFVVLDLNNECI
ncbi:hypothetical protein KSP40_PGU016988 [Platanthera guangdongensis]|uniref:Uncharacterized protein n=1 Tax=Platanthera guangdongensis TaxID=2320717 RepID=A0ABR2LR95_9ASPA